MLRSPALMEEPPSIREPPLNPRRARVGRAGGPGAAPSWLKFLALFEVRLYLGTHLLKYLQVITGIRALCPLSRHV